MAPTSPAVSKPCSHKQRAHDLLTVSGRRAGNDDGDDEIRLKCLQIVSGASFALRCTSPVYLVGPGHRFVPMIFAVASEWHAFSYKLFWQRISLYLPIKHDVHNNEVFLLPNRDILTKYYFLLCASFSNCCSFFVPVFFSHITWKYWLYM